MNVFRSSVVAEFSFWVAVENCKSKSWSDFSVPMGCAVGGGMLDLLHRGPFETLVR